MQVFVLGSFVQACCWYVSRLPKAGETFLASSVHIEAGGKGLNVAVCMQRLGANVELALGIGNDEAGNALLSRLQTECIGVQHVHALATQSGYGAGLIAADGQNSIAIYPGPNLLLGAEHIAQARTTIAQSKLVYGQFETSIDAVHTGFAIAKQNGVITVLNPSPWNALPADLLQNCDVLIVNEVEAAELFGLSALPLSLGIDAVLSSLRILAKRWYQSWSGQCLVVTLGALGSVLFLKNGDSYYEAAHHIIAKDTVGAGDGFSSGFCMQLEGDLQNTDWQNALFYGNACGAIVASQFGVLEALPNYVQVNNFLQQARLKRQA